ncbi:nucleosome-remodeling factor subunit BPTF [Mytilus galloprovincialis]|uniref:Nucleosome-remodeling factor subunit BPTF n=1 Tax=Mytilus galloprovincialis TaxID=29158 RepID=A0A8B6HJ33_MYTGA|nr:nucleosome-remodeling factor subunit BPTF [Mytilus galloprovincialis]
MGHICSHNWRSDALGIDFLRKQGISLDLHRNQLSIHGEVIQMSWGQGTLIAQTTEVRAGKNHTVPANSVQRVMGVLAKPMGREYIIEAKAEGCLLIPRTLHDVSQDPVLCLINLTGSSLVVSKGDLLAQAQEVDEGETPGPKVCKMGVAGDVKEKLLPQHLQEMFTRSCEDLSKGEEETLCSLLQEFQDVFASSDLDLGHFTALEHGIDTGNHPPIKQRMRRTPLGFAQEEEAHLEKMLQSGFTENVDDTIPLAKRPYGSTQTKDTREPVVQISRVAVSKRGDELAIWSEGEGDIWVQERGGDPGVNLGYSQEKLKENQSKDPDLKWVVQWRKTKGEPSEEEIFLSGPAPKYYWLNRELFVLNGDNILYKKGMKGDADRVVIPQVSRKKLMELCHDIPAAGHQGGDRTYQRIKPRYYWRGMKKEIEQYVASCALCSQNKKATRPNRHPMVKHHAGAPMERVHLDFVGPLPKTERGNEHILMMIDQFTKWVECVPLPAQGAELTARTAVNEFFSRFGSPFQGPQGEEIQDREKYVSDLEEAIQGAHELARANLKTAQERLKRDYDLKVVVKRFKVGDLVYQLDTATIKGKCRKLTPSWKGPGVVVESLTPYLYRVKMKTAMVVAHHDRIKLCKDREVPNWCKKLQAQVISRNWKEIEELEPKGKKGKNIYCSCRGPDDGGLMIRCDECREWFHGRCVDITPGEADRMDAYQCPGCSVSTGVHVSRISLHSKVNLFQMDNNQNKPDKSGDEAQPSSPEELRQLDPEVQGSPGAAVEVGGGPNGGSEGVEGKGEVKTKKKRKSRPNKKSRAAKKKAMAATSPLLTTSPQGMAQGQEVCRGQSGSPASCEVATPHYGVQGESVGTGLSCPVSGCEARGPGLEGHILAEHVAEVFRDLVVSDQG